MCFITVLLCFYAVVITSVPNGILWYMYAWTTRIMRQEVLYEWLSDNVEKHKFQICYTSFEPLQFF